MFVVNQSMTQATGAPIPPAVQFLIALSSVMGKQAY